MNNSVCLNSMDNPACINLIIYAESHTIRDADDLRNMVLRSTEIFCIHV